MSEFPPRVFPARVNSAFNQSAQDAAGASPQARTTAMIREKAYNSVLPPSSIELARAHAAERALARAQEYDRINATDKDDWYYVQGGNQFGPVPLEKLKAMIADLSTDPPMEMAWHEGMKEWKPVFEIAHICGVSPLAATQAFKLPATARQPGDGM